MTKAAAEATKWTPKRLAKFRATMRERKREKQFLAGLRPPARGGREAANTQLVLQLLRAALALLEAQPQMKGNSHAPHQES
jgi:hypothetical protein